MAYTEAQFEQLCGIHAFNMLFQERKLVWYTEGPELLYRSLLSDVDIAYAAFLAASKAYQIAEAETQSLSWKKETTAKQLAASKKAEVKPRQAKRKALADFLQVIEADGADASGDEFTNPYVSLNMWNRCFEIQKTAEEIGEVNRAFLCDLEGVGLDGQIPFGVMKDIVESLNYETAVLVPGDPKLPFNTAEFDEFFNKPNCIGAFVNFRHPELFRHYAAIVKFPGAPGIAWADSHDVPIMTPTTPEDIKAKLAAMRDVGDFNALCFVMAKDDSAETEALRRWGDSEPVAAAVAVAGAGAGASVAPAPPLLAMLKNISANAKPNNGASIGNKTTRRGRKNRKVTRKNRKSRRSNTSY